jgi:hypothetical protein
MTASSLPPPMRELLPDRLAQLKQHLLGEIERSASPWRATLPTRLTRPVVRRALVAAATLAVLAAGSGVLLTRAVSDTASAAEVRAKLAEGLRFRESIRGEFLVRTRDPGPRPRGLPGCVNCTPPVPLPSKFVIGTDGSYSSLTLPLDGSTRRDVAYDASTRVETWFGQFSDERTRRPLYLRMLNFDPALAYEFAPEAQLGAWVQGALTDRNPRVENTTYDGRPAWELTVTFRPGQVQYDAYGARVDVVVDQETGLVLQVTRYAYSARRWTSIQSVHDLKIGEPTSADDFTVPKPAAAVERSHDFGFRRVPVAAAAEIVGYEPLLPTNTLGNELSDFAIAKTSNFPAPGIPTRRDAVSARYGHGAAIVTISTYRGPASDLPLIGGGRTVHLTQGPLVGDYAYVGSTPLNAASVTAFHADTPAPLELHTIGLLVRVRAPSAKGAIAVAESLRAVG